MEETDLRAEKITLKERNREEECTRTRKRERPGEEKGWEEEREGARYENCEETLCVRA